MQLPLQITFRDLPQSDALETAIREKAVKLEQFYDRIISCRVVIEAPHQHRHKGKLYHVRIDLTVPGGELVVNRAPGKRQAHEDAYVVIRDAFDAARRQLEGYARRQRGDVKTHEAPPHGRITELAAERGFGRIATTDGREIYFHRNSVVDAAFDQLEVGHEVRFTEESGDQGPQASTVQRVGKHHVVS
jgi:cold shock CspA family protein/ribosome-associated translation inhibitor RaiA